MSRLKPKVRVEKVVLPLGAPMPNEGAANLMLTDSIAFSLRDTHRLFLKPLQSRLSHYGISSGQWYFLRVLWEQQGLNQSELSDRVGLSTPSTVVALNKLENSGLIYRRRDPGDKRKCLIYLSERGAELEKQLINVASTVHDQAISGLTSRQLASFRRTLATIRDNLLHIERF